MSSEVSGCPSDHLRFGRSLYVHVRLSGEEVHDRARPGIGAKSLLALSVSVAYWRFHSSYAATVTPTVGLALSRSCCSATVRPRGLAPSWPDAPATANATTAAALASAAAKVLALPLTPALPSLRMRAIITAARARTLVQFVQGSRRPYYMRYQSRKRSRRRWKCSCGPARRKPWPSVGYVTYSNVLPRRRSASTCSSDCAGWTRSSRSPCAMRIGTCAFSRR